MYFVKNNSMSVLSFTHLAKWCSIKMAKRRLENALRAGQAIDSAQPLPANFEKIKSKQTYTYGSERDGIFTVQYSYDGDLIAAGFGDGGIEVVNAADGKLSKELKKHRYGAFAVSALRFHPKNQGLLLAATSEGNVHACNIEDTTVQDVVDEGHNEINCLDFCRDGTSFGTGGKDLDVRLYDASNYRLLRNFSGYHSTTAPGVAGHAHRIFALRFHPDYNEVFITGGWDNHLKLWDGRTPEGVVKTIGGPHVCGADALDIKDRKILTASWTQKDALQVWDYGENGLIETLPINDGPEGEFLYVCQFCDGEIVLAGGSGTNNLQAISVKDKKVIGEIPLGHSVQALDTYNGGRKLAFGGCGTHLKMGLLE